MDPKIEEFVKAVIEQRVTDNLLYWVITLLVVILVAIAATYLKARSQHLASEHDFSSVLEQLEKTTQLTEQIKSQTAHEEWRAREANSIQRSKLEALLLGVIAAKREIDRCLLKRVHGNEFEFDTMQLDTLDVLAELYFPTLSKSVLEYTLAARRANIFAGETYYATMGKSAEERLKISQDAQSKLRELSQTILNTKSNVEREAANEMQRLLHPAATTTADK